MYIKVDETRYTTSYKIKTIGRFSDKGDAPYHTFRNSCQSSDG